MQILLNQAINLTGTPYRWGGNDPHTGFDCSGLVQALLATVGLDPPGDQTAQSLFDYFDINGERNPKPGIGVLCFYGKDVASITHVSMMLDPYRIVEAGSGDHTVLTLEDAVRKNAFVRIRHISQRKPIAFRKPRYTTIGLV